MTFTVNSTDMNKQQKIQVRLNGVEVGTIKRKVYVDSLGNFNRFACRYNGRTFIVQSEHGDIGDPFRAEESYLTTLYIEVNKPCQWNLP